MFIKPMNSLLLMRAPRCLESKTSLRKLTSVGPLFYSTAIIARSEAEVKKRARDGDKGTRIVEKFALNPMSSLQLISSSDWLASCEKSPALLPKTVRRQEMTRRLEQYHCLLGALI